MFTILHGENLPKSRQKLVELIQESKNKGQQIKRLQAKKLTLAELETALMAQDLFGNTQVVVIEELHSLPTSQRKKDLITLLSKAQIPIILWEKRALTKTMLKKFPQAKDTEFKISKTLFAWLDSLDGKTKNKTSQLKLFHQTIETEAPELCLVMLARQIRLLIQAKEGEKISGPPWMAQKLQRQNQKFTFSQLLKIHQNLLILDIKQKTSQLSLELAAELDLLLLRM